MTDSIAGNDEGQVHGRKLSRRLGPLVPGLLVITLGVVFLLDNFGLVRTWQVVRFWPVILIAAGVKYLWEARDRGAAVNGTLLAAAGGLLLLDNLYVIDVDLWDLWPLILVAIGFRMLSSAASVPDAADESPESNESTETCSAFLGSVERRNGSSDFRGGWASACMGGVNLDLTQADMAGDRAVLQVSVMMGGVEIRVPEDWTTELRVTPIMGGVEDKTRGPAVATKRLVLKGTVLMGGVEIRN